MRASLAAALASSYKLWGARLGIRVDEVTVDVVSEHDARGPMGMTPDVPVGWERVVFDVLLTSDAPEAQVRALLAHCGLEFDERCLRFFENERAVRTASSEQVRRPIYREGVDQWRHYESWLYPLKLALGPVLERYPVQ